MPRRRQGHFNAVKKADDWRQPEVGPKHEAEPRRKTSPDEDDEEGTSMSESSRYSHKKFKKMAEGAGGDLSPPPLPLPLPPSTSLEALFQVTGHELEKMKLSSQDSDGSERCREEEPEEEEEGGGGGEEEEEEEEETEEEEEEAEEEGKLRRRWRRRKKRKTSEGRKAPQASEAEATKRLRLGRHACPYCGLGCGKPSVLQKHIRAHTNERPFPCVPCGFSFKTKSNLYKHRKSRAHHLKASDAAGAPLGDEEPEESSDSRGGEDEDEKDAPSDARRTVVVAGSPQATSIYKPKFHSVPFSLPSPAHDNSSGATNSEEAPGVCANGTSDGASGATGLAKRRNDQFRLRLEISLPPPAAPSSFLPCSSLSSSSSSSCSTTSTSPSTSAASRPEPLTNGGGHLSGGEALARTLKSPKLASPEYLQQHISKLISQNAAIVETLDPLWPRRYTRQSSVASGHGADASELGGGGAKERSRRRSEDAFPSKSKLALALLANVRSPPSAVPSLAAPEVEDFGDGGGSIVRSLLLVDRAFERDARADLPHPQNPEGSIIKDLLLKTRSAGPSLATCMRLSGGSVSSSSTAAAADDDARLLEEPSLAGERRGLAVYSCAPCNISYRKPENLEAHRSRYCPNGSGKVGATATSGGSFSFLGAPEEAAEPGFLPCRSGGQEGELLCQKPRGRPRGSKNRPKAELPGGPFPEALPRIHSKSVSESGGEASQARDRTIDALKGRLCFRRNSVSGGDVDSLKQQELSAEEKTAFESWRSERSIDDGPILKKHLLLGGDAVPPSKKRKGSVDVDPAKSNGAGCTVLSLKSLEQLSKYPMRASAMHLFGGEVQICDGAETKKIVIDAKMSSAGFRGSDSAATSSVVATIAKPVHNSGGTVLRVLDSKVSLLNKPVCIPVVSIGRPLMATGSGSAIVLPAPRPFAIDVARLQLLNPNPMSVGSPSLDAPVPPLLFSALLPRAKDAPASSPAPVLEEDAAWSEPDPPPRAGQVPLIAIHSPRSPSTLADDPLPPARRPPATTPSRTSLTPARPTTLALKSAGASSSVGMTLASPETPRPEKKYGQCYHNGQYYTYLEFKQSTRVYYCNCRPQPMYVPQSVDPLLSMYSMWQTVPAAPDPFGLTPPQAMSLYRSGTAGNAAYSVAKPAKTPLVLTHSSYWTFQRKGEDGVASPGPPDGDDDAAAKTTEGVAYCEVDEEEMDSDVSGRKAAESEEEEDDEGQDDGMTGRGEERMAAEGTSVAEEEMPPKHRSKDVLEMGINEPKRVKIFEGGFKSNEDYTYVRGRGRGKYVCEECGIRCKKPSMLKKHIRTHTDVRPYTCKHCNFSFKTKGNLTKHMKSKAHHKKCVELGIVPVPVTIDDAQIDEEALARQERIEHQRKQFADVDEDSALEEDEDEEDDDEYYDQAREEYKEGEDEDDESMELEGQFEDANEAPLNGILSVEGILRKGCPEQEIARSLLDLGKPEIPVGLPSPKPSSSRFDLRAAQEVAFHQRPISSAQRHGSKRDEREELIGNPRVAWAARAYDAPYDESSERAEDVSVGSGSRERLVPVDPSPDDEDPFVPRSDVFAAVEDELEEEDDAEKRAYARRSSNDDCDQPIDLSMPHSRCERPAWGDAEEEIEEEEEEEEEEEDDEGVVDDEEDDEDEDEIVVDDEDEDDAGEKVGPFYCSFPEFENGANLDPESALPAETSSHRDGIEAPPPPRLRSPCREKGGRCYGGDEWTERISTSPPCGVLHSYLSDRAAAERVSIEVVATVSRHLSSAALPRAAPFGYPASPPPRMDAQRGPPSSPKLPSDRTSRLPTAVVRNLPQYVHGSLDDDKCICTICNKAFNKPSQLRLHVNIHYFERPFRCDSCAISFRTKGHLQKHKRSVSHYNKVNMNMTFGTPTTENPRPFKCDDCKIAFRIHGHLAKHLRSKMHIMKLECLGKLPFGTYAEIERSGANLNEIDTTDCENSLESLQVMAHRLVDKVAVPQHWPRERTVSGGSCDDQSDGVPYVESPLPVPVSGSGVPGRFGGRRSSGDDGCASPDRPAAWRRQSFEGDALGLLPEAADALPNAVKREPSDGRQAKAVVRRRDEDEQPAAGQRTTRSLVQEYEDISDEEAAAETEKEAAANNKRNAVGFACRVCGKSLKSAKFLQLHMYVDHADNASEASGNRATESDAASSSSIVRSASKRRKTSSPLLSISLAASTAIAAEVFGCQLCGERFSSSHGLKQHTLIHARFRPFVCGVCDAGFTNSHSLKLHGLHSHQRGKSFACRECDLVFGLGEDLKHHVSRTHPATDGDRVR